MHTKKYAFLFFVFLVFVALLFFIFQNPYKSLTNIGSRGKAIVAFGDSITAGYGIDPSNAFPAVLQKELGEEVINAGVSGNTTKEALERIDKDVLARNPKIVLVELGGNDFLQRYPEEETKANLEKIIDLIQAKGALVILIGAPSYGGNFNPVYKDIAKRKKCAYIRNILRGIIAHPDLMVDSVHPNEKGHKKIAERILKALKPILVENKKIR